MDLREGGAVKYKQVDRVRFLLFCLAMLLPLACNFPQVAAARPAESMVTQTIYFSGDAGEIPATPSETARVETSTLTPSFTPTFTIVHLATPPGSPGTTRYITDPETRDYAPQRKSLSGSDAYPVNRFERPYTAGTMEYLADVDLTRVEMKIAAPWVYILFFIAGPRMEGIGETMYGVEFDVNRDGRGDYLIWGASPAGTDWTTEGVELWKDTNADVGGPDGQLTNAPWTGGDGYDQRVFSGGQGADPDLVWIRAMAGGTQIQLAFKYFAIGNASSFLWNGLADNGVRRPDWFDYNDHFTQGEAGSPLPIQADYYPLKALFGIDNTCRDAYGFAPTGSEAGLCLYEGTIRGQVAWDIDHSGSLDSTELTIALIAGDTITLGQGACPTAGYRTAVTDTEGRYAFLALPPGTYCVGLIHTVPNPISIAPVTVSLSPGENETVDLPVPW